MATVPGGREPVVAHQDLWQLGQQMDAFGQWLWLDHSSALAHVKPDTSNLGIMGTKRNGATALMRRRRLQPEIRSEK